MTYIFLMAGKGSRLYPLTLKYPKSLYKLDKNTTIFTRMVDLIKKYDVNARIVVVVGFMSKIIKENLSDVIFVENPFYEVTNSIASLWFAKGYLEDDNVTIINGDIVLEEKVVQQYVCKKTDKPFAFIDSSIKNEGDYNVQVNNGKILVMSKDLDDYFGEYAGIIKLDSASVVKLKKLLRQWLWMACMTSGMRMHWYK